MCPLRWNQDLAPRLYYCFLAVPPLTLHPFPSWISNCSNLPFGTQGRSWMLNRKAPHAQEPLQGPAQLCKGVNQWSIYLIVSIHHNIWNFCTFFYSTSTSTKIKVFHGDNLHCLLPYKVLYSTFRLRYLYLIYISFSRYFCSLASYLIYYC